MCCPAAVLIIGGAGGQASLGMGGVSSNHIITSVLPFSLVSNAAASALGLNFFPRFLYLFVFVF